MAGIIAQHYSPGNQLPFSIDGVCMIRADILDRLAGIVANLGLAKLELASAFESGDFVRYESAQFEIETLQLDCSDARADLEHHRAQHGC